MIGTHPPALPVQSAHDVVVVGGGVAGIAAAIAAKRAGCSVLLLERNCILGGLATAGLVNLFVPLCNGRGIQIMKGMAEEFLRTSIRFGYNTLNSAWKKGEPSAPTHLRYATFFSPQIFALQLLERIREEGIDLLFDAVFEDVVCENGRCSGLTVLCEEGRLFFPASVIVDASGSSIVFRRAGAPTVSGRNYFSYHGYLLTLDSCADALRHGDIRRACRWQQGGEANLYGERHPDGMDFFYGDTSEQITSYLAANQQHLLNKLKPDSPESRDLVALPSMPQLRTIRRIQGDYMLTCDDLYRHFDDSVTALCDSERRDSLYEIPFRSMVHREFPNLIAAGRNLSADGYLWDVTRVIPPAILTGQAAGNAAALAVRTNTPVPSISVPALQTLLEAQGVLLHFRDSWVPKTHLAGEYSPASHSHPDREVK